MAEIADLYPETDPQNWVDSVWDALDAGGGSTDPPGVGNVGDNAWFSNNSGDVTLTENTVQFADLDMSQGEGYGGTLALVGWKILASGNVNLFGTVTGDPGAIIECGGSFDSDANMSFDTDVKLDMVGIANTTYTFTSNSISLGDIEFDDSAGDATYQLGDALTAADITLTDGVLDFNDQDVTVTSITQADGTILGGSGNIEFTDLTLAGALTAETSTFTMTASGDVDTGTSRTFYTLATAAGVTMEVLDHLEAKKFVLNGDDVTSAADKGLYAKSVTAGGWWTQNSLVSVKLTCPSTAYSPGDDIVLENKVVDIYSTSSHSMTMDANINTKGGDLSVRGIGAGTDMTLDMAGYNLSLAGGDLKLGNSSGTGDGRAYLGEGIITLTDILVGHNDNDTDELHCETCMLHLLGTLYGNNQGNAITVTSGGANVHGGTIQDVTCTGGPLHCWGVTDGENNSALVCHEGSNIGVALGGMQRMAA